MSFISLTEKYSFYIFPQVKAFISKLLPFHHDVNIKYIPGKDPTMVFLNSDNKVVLEEDVSEMNTDEISQLLEKHGLPKSAEARSEVPEEPDEPEELEELEEPEEEELEEGETEEYDDDDEEDDVTDHTEL